MIRPRCVVGTIIIVLSFCQLSICQEFIGNFKGSVFDFSIHKNEDLLIAPFDTEIILWSIPNQSIVREYSPSHTGKIRTLSFSKDGSLFVSGGLDSILILWSIDNKEPMKVVKNLEGKILTAVFSNDGKYIFASGQSKTISVFNVETGILETSLNGHTDDVLDIEILDNKRFASTGADGMVFIWNIAPFNEITSWQAHKSWVRDMDYKDDLDFIMTVADDGSYRKWSIDPNSIGNMLVSNRVAYSWLTSVDIIDETTFTVAGHNKQVYVQTLFGDYKRNIDSVINRLKIITVDGVYKAVVATMTKGLIILDMSE